MPIDPDRVLLDLRWRPCGVRVVVICDRNRKPSDHALCLAEMIKIEAKRAIKQLHKMPPEKMLQPPHFDHTDFPPTEPMTEQDA